MKALRALEDALIRIEGAVAVALVLLMLALAGYNVFYRNVLVPMQKRWAHSGPPVVVQTPAREPVAGHQAAREPIAGKPSAGAAEGFGGDWGEGDGEAEPAAPAATSGAGVAEGFAGDWGEDGEAPAPAKSAVATSPAVPAGAAEGFGGDWGEGDDGEPGEVKSELEPAAIEPPADELGDDQDPFANLPSIDAAPAQPVADDEGPLGGPPPEGSFAARGVAFIDAIKLGWIDVVLRQLVILVAFFGAMLATHRGKHINVDALSKLLPPRAGRLMAIVANLLALAVCIVLARAGARLVEISREHPKALVPWADEWQFQLMFPLCFGLLAFHFAVRVAEAATGTPPPAPAPAGEGGAT